MSRYFQKNLSEQVSQKSLFKTMLIVGFSSADSSNQPVFKERNIEELLKFIKENVKMILVDYIMLVLSLILVVLNIFDFYSIVKQLF
jgi:aspartokinase-like uncharacterized kinase